MPPLSAVVLKAGAPVADAGDAQAITLAVGAPDSSGLTPVSATIAADRWAETSFAYRLGTGEYTQLGVVHTHLLTLGFIILLVVLALEKLFGLSRSRLFGWFFWVYNAGIILTTAMMLWHGSLTVLGQEGNGMISGIAGLGHILLTAGMVLLFLSLRRGLVLDGVIHDPASAYAANSQAAKADANNTGAVA